MPDDEFLDNELQNQFSALENQISDGGAPSEIPIKEVYANVKTVDLEKALGEATGGKLTSARDVFGLVQKAETLERLSKENAELMAKVNQNPYANEKAKRINEMYASGATEAEVENFLRMQRIDISKMSSMEKVRQSYKMMYPDMNDADIDEYLKETYGDVDEEAMSGSAKIKLRKDAEIAAEQLKKMQVNASETDSERKNKVLAQQHKAMSEGWGRVLTARFGNQKAIEIELPIGDGKSVFKVDFEIPEATKKFALQQLQATAVQSGWKLDVDTLNNQGAQMLENLVFALHGREILAKAVANAQKGGVMQTRKEMAGMSKKEGKETQQHGSGDNMTEVYAAAKNFFGRK